MGRHKLYWGDFHTHLENLDAGDEILCSAKENIDFYAVLCYPFVWEKKNGLRVETVRQRPEFLDWWRKLQEFSRKYYEPGSFVTFLGYEWHGNRTRYGDHNVIYFDENNPLDDTWDLPDLYRNLQERRAIAIPHHTGYFPTQRGKDWNFFNEKLSPVMEIFSCHGSSEGCNTPFPLEGNTAMAPRTTGGTFQDALAKGLIVGVIASNDGPGLPGRWGIGRAGVWAEECTRESIWEAVLSRRTYAVTGDRIELDFSINNAPMGSIIKASGSINAEVNVRGSNAIDRIELLQNGIVVDTYCHSGKWEKSPESKRFKVFIHAGWGPATHFGYNIKKINWQFNLEVEKGHIIGLEKCFTHLSQKIKSKDEKHCTWEFLTTGHSSFNFGTLYYGFGMCQGIVFELEGSHETVLHLEIENEKFNISLADLTKGSFLFPLLGESRKRTFKTFGLKEEEIENPDTYYHNARKIKIHRAIPESGYDCSNIFKKIKLEKGRNYFYVRVSQLNGQMAWSSPIWVDSV